MLTDLLFRYSALQQETDAWFARCVEKAGPAVRCTSGCSACCHSLFDITLLDALQLQAGLALLPVVDLLPILDRARAQVLRVQRHWPGFVQPFLLNDLPVAGWELPEEDQSPCPLLSQGKCLLYSHRPLTCRLHGLANIDVSGEVFEAEGCSLHAPMDSHTHLGLRWEFRRVFGQEARLLRELAGLLGRRAGELDTFISSGLLIDFEKTGARR